MKRDLVFQALVVAVIAAVTLLTRVGPSIRAASMAPSEALRRDSLKR